MVAQVHPHFARQSSIDASPIRYLITILFSISLYLYYEIQFLYKIPISLLYCNTVNHKFIRSSNKIPERLFRTNTGRSSLSSQKSQRIIVIYIWKRTAEFPRLKRLYSNPTCSPRDKSGRPLTRAD